VTTPIDRDTGIDRRRFLKLAAGGVAGAIIPGAVGFWSGAALGSTSMPAVGGDRLSDLVAAFAEPPALARPGVYWYWLGGAVTREGISADLEAMRDAGISTAMVFSIGKGGEHPQIQPPADALTPPWWAMVEHAVNEAARLGVTLAMNMCDGWATASGPWITPGLSMQKLVWSETVVDGGKPFDAILAQPEATLGYYRDVATHAWPVDPDWEGDSASLHARVHSDLPVDDLAALARPDNLVQVIDTDRAGWFQFDFAEPFTLRSVTVRTAHASSGYSAGVYRAANSLHVQASDDGVHFRTIGRLDYPRHGWQTDMTTLTHAIAPTTARSFRLVHEPEGPFAYEEDADFGQDTRLKLSSLVLSAMPRVHLLPVKSGAQWGRGRRAATHDLPDAACVAVDRVVDLGAHMDTGGRLRWTPPAGRWRVVRMGMTTTGAKNSAAGLGEGLECDRFNPEAARLQFDHWFGQVLDRVGPKLAGKVLHVLHVDSWEAGTQNWSPRFAAAFARLRGYSLDKYLLCMTGVPLQSAETTERVLNDVRRTIAELVNENFFAPVSELAHRHGCILSCEPASPTFPVDGLDYARYADFPMGEFWMDSPRNDKPTDIKDAVSGGRIHGRRAIGAEAFTDVLIKWTEHPYTFKALGDRQFCAGINRFMLHVWAMQPWTDRAPGMTLSGIGTFFGRTQSWWKPGKAWFDYLGRAQALLQCGRAVSDVAYFIGEDIPSRSILRDRLQPALPAGHAYDCLNADALLRLARVENGELCLESGMRYRVLALPADTRMSAAMAARIEAFVDAGLTVVGPRPQGTPGLEGGGHADAAVRAMADRLWDGLDGTGTSMRRHGRGRVCLGAPMTAVLDAMNLAADVTFDGAATPEWIHRAGDGWDLYFFSNQGDEACTVDARLRVSGRLPEFLYADDGRREDAPLYRDDGRFTSVSLRLDPRGSVFVLLARPAPARNALALRSGDEKTLLLQRHGIDWQAWATGAGHWTLQESGHAIELSQSRAPAEMELTGWKVSFAERLRVPHALTMQRPHSWTEATDDAIRFYSGTAVYDIDFSLPAAMLASGARLFLDLGEVADLAEVTLNGQALGVLWKPPYRVEIGAAVHIGDNRLRIAVSNTWRNRLIGDHDKTDAARTTYVVPMKRKDKPWLPGGPDAKLSPAGLLGAVHIVVATPLMRGS
jgi:hypothetical protein